MLAALASRRRFAGCCLVAALLTGCSQTPPPPAGRAPEKPKVEGELAFTTLSKVDAAALKIKSEAVQAKGEKVPLPWVGEVQERLQLTGWIMAPQGNEVTITAPVAGYVRLPSKTDTALPIAGRTATAGQELFTMQPVLTPLEALQFAMLKRGVEGELKKAEADVKLAKVERKRTLDLFAQKIKQQQDVDLAEKKLQHAEEDLSVAKDKLERFKNPDVPIIAPRRGTVLTVSVSPGQYVPSAAPLVTIADLSTLWIRVQVPESDLPYVDRARGVQITRRNGEGGEGKGNERFSFTAKPVALVPQVDTARHTADMIYELQPPKQGDVFFAKDQMVTVLVPVGRQRAESVVPPSAIIYDAHGGAWVYVEDKKETKFHRYERRRVELGPTIDQGVVIRNVNQLGEREPALKAGEFVVTEGAALLFSREFHKTPVNPVNP